MPVTAVYKHHGNVTYCYKVQEICNVMLQLQQPSLLSLPKATSLLTADKLDQYHIEQQGQAGLIRASIMYVSVCSKRIVLVEIP